jgi:hypothetical protein
MWMSPLTNVSMHAAVVAGVAIELATASLRVLSDLLRDAAIHMKLWGVVGCAPLAWKLAEAFLRLAWRQHARAGEER